MEELFHLFMLTKIENIKVLHGFPKNDHTAWFEPQTEKFKPHCFTIQYCSVALQDIVTLSENVKTVITVRIRATGTLYDVQFNIYQSALCSKLHIKFFDASFLIPLKVYVI